MKTTTFALFYESEKRYLFLDHMLDHINDHRRVRNTRKHWKQDFQRVSFPE